VECITLEENCNKTEINNETESPLHMLEFCPTEDGGTLVTLQKTNPGYEFPAHSIVKLCTENNITFKRGKILNRENGIISLEFRRLHSSNLSIEALGDLIPTELVWKLESEPESSFGFNIMRNNLF